MQNLFINESYVGDQYVRQIKNTEDDGLKALGVGPQKTPKLSHETPVGTLQFFKEKYKNPLEFIIPDLFPMNNIHMFQFIKEDNKKYVF